MPGVRRLIRRTPRVGTSPDAPADLLARIAAEESLVGDEPPEQTRSAYGRLLAQLAPALASSARHAGVAAVASGKWLADVVVDAAPRLPIRDLATLQRQFPGQSGEELADTLVRQAMVATAAIGVTGGALSALKWTAPPTLLTVPVQLAVETAAVAAVEIKLVAELHQVYGYPAHGGATQRGTAYALAWANRRGVNPLEPATMSAALGSVARQRVQRRLLGRAGRGLGVVAPMMLGAAYGALSNRRQTRLVADELRVDLRRNRPLTGGLTGRVVNRALRAGSSGRPAAGSGGAGTRP